MGSGWGYTTENVTTHRFEIVAFENELIFSSNFDTNRLTGTEPEWNVAWFGKRFIYKEKNPMDTATNLTWKQGAVDINHDRQTWLFKTIGKEQVMRIIKDEFDCLRCFVRSFVRQLLDSALRKEIKLMMVDKSVFRRTTMIFHRQIWLSKRVG